MHPLCFAELGPREGIELPGARREFLGAQPASPPPAISDQAFSGKQQVGLSQELVFSQEFGFQPGVDIC